MWGKTMEREDSPLTAPPVHASPLSQPPKVAASIGKAMKFRGEMYSEEELYLDGQLEGTLEVRHRLTIGPNGKVKASIKAKEIVVRGWVEGNVEAEDRIVIMNGASILGDVKTAGIVIEDGAFFKGAIDIIRQTEPASPALSTAAKSHHSGG